MVKKKEMKSVQFKRLLPEIYQKIIIEHYTHQQVSEWLLEKHDLDLTGKNHDAKPFSNYLSVYGAIKTAKDSYAANVDNQEYIAQNWYKKFTDSNNSKTTEPSKPNTVDVESEKIAPRKTVKDEASVPAASALRQAEKYKESKPKRVSVEDAMAGYNNKL